MGPLGKVWSQLEGLKKGGLPLPINNMLEHVEQSVLLVGQANVVLNHNRRLNVLAIFLRDHKKAAEVLSQNKTLLQSNKEKLFGRSFYKALYKKAVGNKHSKEIRSQLGSQKSRKPGQHAYQSGRQQQSKDKKPFQKGPSSYNTYNKRGGGHTKNNYRGAKSSNSKPRYVLVAENTKHVKSSSKSGECGPTQHGTTVVRLPSASIKHKVGSYLGTRKCGGQTALLCGKLEVDFTRSKDHSNCDRSSDRFHSNTLSGKVSSKSQVFQRTVPADFKRGNGNVEKKRHYGNRAISGSIHRSPIRSSKKIRRLSTDIQPQETERVREIRTFQDGGNDHVIKPDTAGGLDVQTRSQRCVLRCPDQTIPPEVPTVRFESENVPIPSSPIRAGISPENVHKITETSSRVPSPDRNTVDNIFGRHHPNEPKPTNADHRSKQLLDYSAATGLHCKYEKVTAGAITNHRLPGIPDQLDQHDTVITREQSSGYQSGMLTNTHKSKDHFEGLSKVDREIDILYPSSVACSATLQTVTDAENQSTVQVQPELWSCSGVIVSEQRGATLVDPLSGQLEWSDNNNTSPRPHNNFGFVQERLGGRVQGSHNSRVMDISGASRTHQLLGTQSSDVCGPIVQQECREMSTYSPPSGQYYNNGPNKQDGGHKVGSSVRTNQGTLALLSVRTDNTYSRTCSGEAEHHSRPPIQSIPRQQRLDAKQGNVPPNAEGHGKLQYRPVCRQDECSASDICRLEARSSCRTDGRVQHELVAMETICLPTILHGSQMPGKTSERPSNSNINHASLANTTMVSNSDGNVDRTTDSTSTPYETPSVSTRGDSSTSSEQNPKVSGLEGFRGQMQTKGLSGKSTELLLQSWRDGTKSAYRGPWNKWVDWCQQRQVLPFQASVANIANFLSECFDRGLEYSTLNGYRSALSAFHPEVDGFKVGQHPIIKRILQGAFNGRPPMPRYNDTWEVDKVLNFLLYQEGELSLKDVTLKLTMLLALTTASRGSELRALNPNFMLDKGDTIVFQLGKLTKSRRSNKPLICVTLNKYDMNDKLDVISCLRKYITMTPQQKEQLLLSYINPHKPVVTCTIARWLKMIMAKSGIDVSVYKAHSTRSASTSKAKTQGVTTEEILHRANWSKAATFYRFYNRGTDVQSKFQNSVLSTEINADL